MDAVGAPAQHAVFRVIQEALSNAYRHARAEQVLVTLASRGGVLTVCVADDGRGFQPEPEVAAGGLPSGVGIPGMRAWLEQLGGRLEIVEGASGTRVTASIPLGASGLASATIDGESWRPSNRSVRDTRRRSGSGPPPS
jgi:two-component system, NarL family, sensor kinase